MIDYRHPAMRILRSAVRKELRIKILAAMGLLGIGISMVAIFFNRNIILVVIGLAGIVFGIRFGFELFRLRRVGDHPLFRCLLNRPGQIVWVYSVVTQRMPFGFQTARSGLLYFKLIDGSEITVGLPEKHLRLVSHYMNRLLPHATFGYSRDKEQWYMASPEMLLRSGS